MAASGRNGGHLTPKRFFNFRKRELAYGTDQAVRSADVESYTCAELVKIIKTENLDVDLVAGGHVAMLVTEKEVETAQADYAAAKAAGVNLDDVEWLSKEVVESVSASALRYHGISFDLKASLQTYGPSHGAYRFPAYNLWPLKLATELYKLAKEKRSNFSLDLYTRTPVTAVSPIPNNDSNGRRWLISTPRGDIRCTYVIHATNGYAGYLLPQLQGTEGIIPTRGQVIALQANGTLSELTKASWASNERFEYWFPRPVKMSEGGKEEHPIVILGGGRQLARPDLEQHETDDSVLRSDVGKYLRAYLPELFPGKYKKGREPVMEWVCQLIYSARDAADAK
jgi:glycine/D-amino acid oxidase-like deaminating enzyme